MHLLGWLKSIERDERGNAIVVAAATLPLIIGAAAIGVDTIQVSVARHQLQRSADSAAIAGAYALVQEREVPPSVNHDLALNNDVPLSSAPIIQNAPASGPYAGNNRAVRVILSSQRPVPFFALFSSGSMNVSVEATAAYIYTGQYCVVSLETANVTGVIFAGNATTYLGCGVISNARSTSAVTAGGSSTVTASPIAAVGGVPPSASYVGTTRLLPYSPPQPDPYAALPQPSVPTVCNNELRVQPNDAATTVQPGCYRGMDIKGTVTLAPGTYVIDGGTLSFGSQANVTALGVTFILTSRTAASDPSSIADVSINGGAQLNFSAPASGTYAGVLMYQDRRAPDGSSQINGNSASSFQGGFYFPGRQLTFNGTTGMQTQCLQLVARRVTFSGDSNIQNVCPANSGAHAFDATAVRLVG
jgi:Putative Flp pilus-assembly TadE/G-like